MSAKIEYGILLLISTLFGYYGAKAIENAHNLHTKKLLLVLGIIGNLGILFWFKYANFINENLQHLFKFFSLDVSSFTLSILLPVGISFYTFQAIGYLIDVYKKNIPAEKKILVYAVYHAFFPQLVAGPIERGGNLLPQFYKKRTFSTDNLHQGLGLILWGFFKKLVVADNLALAVNPVYASPSHYGGADLLIATVLFTFQIYFDFSGYTDIARGSAKILGFNLMLNFNRPFFSKNISEFWRRWHISLSTWFRDYLYIPLGGNRGAKIRTFTNILLVFTISGLWHGANWTFLAFGLYHGVMISLYNLFKNYWDAIPQLVQQTFTFFIVCIGFLFFRANTLSDAVYIITGIFKTLSFHIENVGLYSFPAIALSILFLKELVEERGWITPKINAVLTFLSPVTYILLAMYILLFGLFSHNQFIYFQF